MCNISGPAYYLNYSTYAFSPCSSGCNECNSSNECFSCVEHYFLQYNGVSNFSCRSCSDFYNCSTCFLGNHSQKIGYNEYKAIGSLTEFNIISALYQWDVSCLSCVSITEYTRKIDAKCYKCTDLIDKCISCSYGNSSIADLSSFYQTNLIFTNLSQYISSYFAKCHDCGEKRYPLIDNLITTCESCDRAINNCSKCNYGYLNSSLFLIYPNDFYNKFITSHSNYTLRCLECSNEYGLADSTQISCTSCPKNCEYCYLNSTNITMFCGRCLDYYVLNIYEGLCYVNTSYPTVKNYYNGKCLKMVSKNPWVANLTGSSSSYLCQKCTNSNLYPSISGNCVSCSNGTCSNCIETSTFLSDSTYTNYTELLYNSPINLIDYITTSTDYTALQRCLKCSKTEYGYNDQSQYCCYASQNININLATPGKQVNVIDWCSQCSSCNCASNILFCSKCSLCKDVPSLRLNSEVIIKSLKDETDYNSLLYGKKIYYALKNEAFNFSTIPVLNDTLTYTYLYGNLTSQTQIDLAGAFIYQCTACPINSKSCYVNSEFEYSEVSSAYNIMAIDLNQQLSYRLYSYECKNGFVYDFTINRCKFCPKNWLNCKAFKRLDIYFSLISDPNDPFIITSLEEFYMLMQQLNSGTLSYILNEFAVKSLEIYLNFPSDSYFFLTYSLTEFTLSSLFKIRIPSLQDLSIIFQPENYEENSEDLTYLYFPLQWSFEGFDHIYFKNIVFYILPFYASGDTPIFPGIIVINAGDFVMKNCQFLESPDTSEVLVDGELLSESDKNNYEGPFDIFLINIVSTRIYLDNLTYNCSIAISSDLYQKYNEIGVLNLAFLQLNGDSIFITNIFINQMSLNYGYFLFTKFQEQLSFENFTLLNLKLSNNSFFYLIGSTGSSYSFENLLMINSELKATNLFGGLIESLIISNFSITNTSLKGSDSFKIYSLIYVDFVSIYLNKFSLISLNLTAYNLIIFKENTQIIHICNFLAKNNNFVTNEESSYALFFIFYSSSMLSLGYFENSTLIQNQIELTFSSVRAYFFNINNALNITIVNASSFENPNSSFIYIWECNYIYINKFYISNQQLDLTNYQCGFNLEFIHKSIYLVDLFFENVTTYDSLFNIVNWIADDINGTIFIKNLKVNQIYYYEEKAKIGSGIIIISKKKWEIIMINCSFSNSFLSDYSDYSGSSIAISLDSLTSSLYLQNSSFMNLTSTGTYGALFINLLNFALENCEFKFGNYYLENNVSLTYSSRIITQGTYLNLRAATISILNSNFELSYGLNGGAIYINNINKASNVTIFDTHFTSIYSIKNGGVFYYMDSADHSSYFKIENCSFIYIFSIEFGGILYVSGISLKDSSIIFKNCLIKNFDSNMGSIVYSEFSSIYFYGSLIDYNYDWYFQKELYNFFSINENFNNFNSSSRSGSLYYQKYGVLFIENSSITNILSPVFSPAILDLIKVDFTCNNCFFVNISYHGSCFYVSQTSMSLLNNIVYNVTNNAMLTTFVSEKIFSFIYMITDSNLSLINSVVSQINCTSCSKGAFLYTLNSAFSILNSIIKNNSAINGGAIYGYFTVASYRNYIDKCSFINNSASINGGSLFIMSAHLEINDSNFSNNIAEEGNGGAIYYDIDKTINTNLFINRSNFENNYAWIAGAIYYSNIKIQIESTNFNNNSAKHYGKSLYSYPQSLRIIASNNTIYSNNTFIINSIRSGATLPNIVIQMLDEENTTIIPTIKSTNPVISLSLDYNKLNLASIYSINQTSFAMESNGSFRISYLLLISRPTDLVSLIISSSSIYVPNDYDYSFSQNYSYSLSIQLRECIIGEIFQNLTGMCFPCDQGTFSFNINDECCSKCLEGLDCLNSLPKIKSGYWRNRNYSLAILPCFNIEGACVGGNSSGNDICLIGHIGARCESCDLMGRVWGTSYSRAAAYECVSCNDLTYNYIILAVLALVNFVSMALSIAGALKQVEQTLKLRVIGLLSRYSMLKTFQNESSIYIKIYLSYFQILQALTTFELTYPNWTNTMTTTIGNPTESSLYSTDCLIKYFGDIIPYIYIKLVIAILVPLLYFSIFSLGYVLFISRFKIHRKYAMLYTASLFTLIYFQPTVINNTIGVLSCLSVGENTYIKADVSYLCETPDYWYYSFVIGIPALVLWGFLVPGVILWRLIVNKKDLNEIRMKVRYGYIYGEYKIFYWEFVKMYQKILITIFLQFYQDEIWIKGLMILLILALYFVLLSKFKPYKTILLTKVDQISTAVLYASIFLGLLSYKNRFSYLVTIAYFIILTINLAFNAFMISKIFRTYSSSFETFLDKIRKKIPKCFLKKKEMHTLKNWRILRRSVAKYLRERERMKKNMDENFKYNLSLENYNPEKTGLRKLKKNITKTIIKNILESDQGESSIESESAKIFKIYDTKEIKRHGFAKKSLSGPISEEKNRLKLEEKTDVLNEK